MAHVQSAGIPSVSQSTTGRLRLLGRERATRALCAELRPPIRRLRLAARATARSQPRTRLCCSRSGCPARPWTGWRQRDLVGRIPPGAPFRTGWRQRRSGRANTAWRTHRLVVARPAGRQLGIKLDGGPQHLDRRLAHGPPDLAMGSGHRDQRDHDRAAPGCPIVGRRARWTPTAAVMMGRSRWLDRELPGSPDFDGGGHGLNLPPAGRAPRRTGQSYGQGPRQRRGPWVKRRSADQAASRAGSSAGTSSGM